MANRIGNFPPAAANDPLQPGAALSVNNLPPFLVIWLFFVVNPGLADEIVANSDQNLPKDPGNPKTFGDIADALNMDEDNVRNIFGFIQANHGDAVKSAANAFQAIADDSSGGGYQGGGQYCVASLDLLYLAGNGATSVWT